MRQTGQAVLRFILIFIPAGGFVEGPAEGWNPEGQRPGEDEIR